MSTERVVTGCADCPFGDMDSTYRVIACGLVPEEEDPLVVDWNITGAPAPCPLRRGPVTLRLQEGE